MKIVVPETSDLRRVYQVVKAIHDGLSPHDSCGLSQRQASYALQAALTMNLLTKEDEASGDYIVAPLGTELLLARWGSSASREVLRRAIQGMPLFELFPDLLDPSLDTNLLAQRLEENPRTALSKTTAQKRASAIRQWLLLLAKETIEDSQSDVVLLVHLSDIHFHRDRSLNPILNRASAMAAALSASFELWPLAGCVIALSGDIAQSGCAEEYSVARGFLSELKKEVESRLRCEAYFVAVPGNHDCNFDNATSVREQLLAHLSLEKLDDAIYQTVQCTQEAFERFSQQIESTQMLPEYNSMATSVATLKLGKHVLRFDKYNTAWCSQLKEQQGSLMFPVPQLSAELTDGDAVIAVLHHPLSWIENVSARAFRQHLASSADIVLTGHEHVSERYALLQESGEQTEYSEGSVLQERSDEGVCEFNALLLNFNDSSQQSYKFSYTGTEFTSQASSARAFKRAAVRLRNAFRHSQEMIDVLHDPGDAYAHPRKRNIILSDIYVVPQLKPAFISGNSEHLADATIELVLKEERLLILGQELAGKTTLSKMLAASLYEEGKTPLLIKGIDIKSASVSDLDALRSKKFVEQYGPNSLEAYRQLSRDRKSLIIDDAHLSKLTRAELHSAISCLERAFGYCVVVADEEFPMALLDAKCAEDSGVLAYETFALQPFGAVRRYRLVEKWCYLGRTASEDEKNLSCRAQRIDELLGKAMGSSLLPALPCLILLCLQQIDGSQRSELSDGSFGHLYDALVTTNLSLQGRATIDVGSKRTLLSRFAYKLYAEGVHSAPLAEWNEVYKSYLEDYDASFSATTFLDELLQSNLLKKTEDGEIAFRYNYSYCLFVASFLIKTHSPDQLRERAMELCNRLHEDEAANILLFLAHFDADGPVSETLLDYSRDLVPTVPTFELHKALLPLGSSTHISNLTLDASTPEERRNIERERRDQMERSGPSNDLNSRGLPEQLCQYVRALRTVHILGQVLKSSSGTMVAPRKAKLLHECYGLSTRTVATILAQVVQEHGELSEDLARLIIQHRPELEGDLAAVKQQLRRFLVSLCEGLVYNTALYVSSSVGAASLVRTYERVSREATDPMSQLFDLAIRLDHFSPFPEKQLKLAVKTADSKPSPSNVLRLLVWRHLYLFPVEYRLRQQLCKQFDIKERHLLSRRQLAMYN
jgi:energy-coupling factor transporter ATP-binding protein EcfA2